MKILITGATGTLGTEVLRQLNNLGHHRDDIIGITRSENKFRSLSNFCKPVLCDIRDQERVVSVSKKCDLVFHFAALKHVDILENSKSEALATNINGTINLLTAQKINSIQKLVFASTDQAMYPINIYGMT